MQTIIPYLAYEDAPAALTFLRDAFGFTERFRMEFRFEMFNATNTPVWAVPVSSLENSNFGKVTHAANIPRQLQFGLKLYF